MASASAISEPTPVNDLQEYGTKRRQSEEPEETIDSKRQRTSPGKNSPPAARDIAAVEQVDNEPNAQEQRSAIAGDARRKSGAVVDEKQRSKRLFGALLGNLRQPGDRTSKRRQEIETRRKAELKRQDDERLEDRQRRQEQLVEQRKVAQVKVDEQSMHRRHRAILDKANFLQTETEPRLFYRPWDLRDDEEDRIDGQIREAHDLIDKEVVDFQGRHGRESTSQGGMETGEAGSKDEKSRLGDDAKDELPAATPNGGDHSGQDQASAKSDQGGDTTIADVPEATATTDTNDTNKEEDRSAEVRPTSAGAEMDDGDGEHVDGDEDAVIY